jgi:hypothetical protein
VVASGGAVPSSSTSPARGVLDHVAHGSADGDIAVPSRRLRSLYGGGHALEEDGMKSMLPTALLFLVVMPAIILLVSNPLGWIVLLMLCFGFAYLFGFGSIL